MFTFFAVCLLVGALAGFLAGLFGVGGGLVIVPALVYILPLANVPEPYIMSTALGTSFATIVVTGFSSAQRHHKLGNVVWPIAKILAPIVMLSTFLSGFVVGNLPRDIASKIFACLVVFLAVKMFLSIKQTMGNKPLNTRVLAIGGTLIGIFSSAAGIGGGGFIVPFLNARGVEIKKAIGSSALCGMLLGLAGMSSFILSGLNKSGLPNYSLGYVYLPAVLAITLTSFLTSKLGATTTSKLPVSVLKKSFALFLCIIAVNMFIG